MNIYLTTKKWNPFSFMIRLFSKSKVSHLAFDDPERPTVVQSTRKGFLPLYKKAFLAQGHVKITFKFRPFDSDKRHLVIEAFWELLPYIGSGYDKPAIFGFIPYLLLGEMAPKANRLGREDLVFCSEAFYLLLKGCASRGVIKDKILAEYDRESFTPQNALELMLKYPEVFEKV